MRPTIVLYGLAEEVGGWLTDALEVEVQHARPGAGDISSAQEPGLVIASDAGHSGEVVPFLRMARASSAVRVLFCIDPAADAQLGQKLIALGLVDRLLILPLDRETLVTEAIRLGGYRRRLDAEDDRMAAGLSKLWERYRDTIMERVQDLEDAGVALLDGSLAVDARREAERQAHKLAGSAGSFGFPTASAIARDLEQILASERIEAPDVLRFAEGIVRLRTILDSPPVASRADSPTAAGPPILLILDPDRAFAEEVAKTARSRGIQAVAATRAAEVRERMMGERSELVVLDLGAALPSGSSINLLRLLSEADPPIPFIVSGTTETLHRRVEAARLGAHAFLEKPVPAPEVVAETERILHLIRPVRTCVTAVDDDPVILETIASLLGERGYEVSTISDPLSVISRLPDERPDLLILDVDMPHLTGIELCRVLRLDAQWQSLPILFLTGRRDADTVRQVFECGADDFILKPIIPEELTSRVENRLERVRLYRRLAETDFLTGLPNRRKTAELFEQLRRIAERHRQPLSLAVLDLDHFKRVNDEHGHQAGDRVLRWFAQFLKRTFRGEDVVGRWGGEEFVLGMYAMRRNDAVNRLRRALEDYRRNPVPLEDGASVSSAFSAGVAELGLDGADLESLYRSADAALYQAKEAGRSRIRGTAETGADDAANARLDVLLVEDDDPLAALLIHALSARGYRVERIHDGREALDWLDPRQGAPGARVVLLDVDLPGLDGLALLRRLTQLGVTETTRIIMLTARANEPEVVDALELGAFDHVAKPFSVPVLMQRVRRALEA